MDKIGEIRELKSLLDEGKISESEFQLRKIEILENANKESIVKNKKPLSENISAVNPTKVSDAGNHVRRSVNAQIISFVSNFVGIIIFMYGFVELIIEISKGHSLSNYLSDSPTLFIGFLFLIVGFIFWIKSLTRMHTAGKLLEQSSY